MSYRKRLLRLVLLHLSQDYGSFLACYLSIKQVSIFYLLSWRFVADASDTALARMGDADVFAGGSRDQVMLFTRPPPHQSSLPIYAINVLEDVRHILEPLLPSKLMEMLFQQPLARQTIVNLYPPGQGISPHIDLPNRYADGIIGVSLLGGCVMTFRRQDDRYDVYLPERTIYVMSGAARWEWSHGIEGRAEDLVDSELGVVTKLRGTRVSMTFRWMQDGADVLS